MMMSAAAPSSNSSAGLHADCCRDGCCTRRGTAVPYVSLRRSRFLCSTLAFQERHAGGEGHEKPQQRLIAVSKQYCLAPNVVRAGVALHQRAAALNCRVAIHNCRTTFKSSHIRFGGRLHHSLAASSRSVGKDFANKKLSLRYNILFLKNFSGLVRQPKKP